MEALNFLKFWKPTVPFPTPVIEIRSNAVEEDEDSFFELESLKLSPESDQNDAKTRTAMDYPKPSLSFSPINPIPKRKVLPLETPVKPQSPITLLKSSPNFRAFSFKKSKSKSATESPKPSILVRESSLRRREETAKQERVSKDVIQRYIRLVKPLYVKVSKRCHGSTVSELFAASPSASPASERSNFRVACKHLGKSKSTTNSAVTVSCSGRRDDSLLQHDDGIQSAILHCKRSFSSSRDSCSLSRSTSDSSSMKSCSIDSYRISHSASETSHDFSARNSLEDGRVSV